MFRIEANSFSWMGKEEDDSCLHGNVEVVTENHTIGADDITVSASALYFLKTITEDHIIYKGNQMLPCCGFFYIPNDELDNVVISGCDIGVDWTILHDSGNVIFVFDDGTQEKIPLDEYRSEVFRFADEVEDIYKQSKPKKISMRKKDEFERNGQIAFWNEWHRRRRMQ